MKVGEELYVPEIKSEERGISDDEKKDVIFEQREQLVISYVLINTD